MIITEERVESLLCETQSTRLAAKICEFDPHLGVFPRSNDESSNLENTLPNIDISFTSFQSI